MSSAMPELGSKISLISKADIRYEGHLFTVDPQQCTIALSAVRSFGTEERETNYPVPPQNQVYDYILFRGSDIKDIRVVNNMAAVPNDPAIVQLSLPQSLSTSKGFQPQGFAHPVLGQMGQFGAGGGAYGAAPGGPVDPRGLNPMAAAAAAAVAAAGVTKPSELNSLLGGAPPHPAATPSVLEPPPPPTAHIDNDLIGGASRSTTPASLGSRKSPTADQGTQAGGKKDGKFIRPIQPPRGNKERRDSRGDPQQMDNRNQYHQTVPHHHHHHQQMQHQQHQHQHQHQQHQQQQQQRQGNWVQRGQPRQRARGRPRGGIGSGTGMIGNNGGFGGPQNNAGFKYSTRQMQKTTGGKAKIKFDSEYDFEQANSQFEELCGKLSKAKLEDAGSKTELNGGTVAVVSGHDADKKDDSGNETGAGETELEEDAASTETFYDKARSFFDNISCEAVERSKGRSQRTDWRTERKLNSETFGVASARRGVYRGRGGYRGNFRGGYRGGYRNQQHYQGGGGNGGGGGGKQNQLQNNQHSGSGSEFNRSNSSTATLPLPAPPTAEPVTTK